jgi:glycosyltransferase involved in cell wall biosynthesis
VPSVHIHYPGDGGCQYHRLLCPARFLTPLFGKEGWDITLGPGLPRGHDVYLYHGLCTDPGTLLDIGRIRHDGKTFVWSVDDDWLSIPDWNPAHPGLPGWAMYQLMKGTADYVLTSTPALWSTFTGADAYPVENRRNYPRVLCAPNLMDLHGFPDPPPVVTDPDGKNPRFDLPPSRVPVKVVWSGGPTHKGDTAVLDDVLCRVLEKFGMGRVTVVFVGQQPPPKLLKNFTNRGLVHQPGTHFAGYQSLINSVHPDIYLCPLAPIEFNRSKSAIRVFEGWALRAAPVATDWGEYAVVRNGVDGRLVAPGDDEGWFSALDRLIRDPGERVRLAVNGYCRVTHEFNWQNPRCLAPWVAAFNTITGASVPVPTE